MSNSLNIEFRLEIETVETKTHHYSRVIHWQFDELLKIFAARGRSYTPTERVQLAGQAVVLRR